jgi:hypothetical protein
MGKLSDLRYLAKRLLRYVCPDRTFRNTCERRPVKNVRYSNTRLGHFVLGYKYRMIIIGLSQSILLPIVHGPRLGSIAF